MVKASVVACIWGFIGATIVLAYFAHDLPDISQVTQYVRRPSIVLLARDGTPFHRLGETQGELVNAAELPPHLVNAVLAIEDRRFFWHIGLDPIGLTRAVVVNLRSGRAVQGGSTITQQLAKNLFLSPERTIKRKIQEALLALWLEYRYSKNQILSAYLNRVYLGAGTYGVEAAARTYFNKPASALNLHESAIIAGLLKAPSRFSPSNNSYLANQRAKQVLAAMVDAGYTSLAQANMAQSAPPRPRPKPGAGGTGRHFADWAAELARGYVGPNHPDLIVTTTLDLRLQRDAEAQVDGYLAGDAKPLRASQASLVAMAYDGAVRTMVGGNDYAATQFNRAVQAQRQPGSAFKPFVYLTALEAGYDPETEVLDAPIAIGSWRPGNFNGRYRGPIPLKEALAHSVNSCAVRLADAVGVDAVTELAAQFGLVPPANPDLSLALGTTETTLLDLTAAYAGIANRGRPTVPYAVTEIRDRDNRVLYRHRATGVAPAANPGSVIDLTRMMMGTIAFGTGRAAKLDREAAGKTGTSQDHRDAWFVGFTADLVAGVWFGNDNNRSMKRVTGGSLPARLWRDFMQTAHAGLPARPLLPPQMATVATSAQPGAAAEADASALDALILRLSPLSSVVPR